jgi:hypothetical protein
MRWIPVGVAVLAAWFFGFGEHPALAWTSIGVALVALWSYGVMHNFAMEAARSRLRLLADNMRVEGRSAEEVNRVLSLPVQVTPYDAQAAPNALTFVNMAATLIAVVMLVVALIL